MNSWEGKRLIAVVTACLDGNGVPRFCLNDVEATYAEYRDRTFLNLINDRLARLGVPGPYKHFEAFLDEATRDGLGLPKLPPGQVVHLPSDAPDREDDRLSPPMKPHSDS